VLERERRGEEKRRERLSISIILRPDKIRNVFPLRNKPVVLKIVEL
jgi:hypothetical protein